MTIALVLGGGAQNLTLMAGAVRPRLTNAGVKIDVVQLGRGHVRRPAPRAEGRDE